MSKASARPLHRSSGVRLSSSARGWRALLFKQKRQHCSQADKHMESRVIFEYSVLCRPILARPDRTVPQTPRNLVSKPLTEVAKSEGASSRASPPGPH